ncbi:MAG TPA: FUSC family protein [Terriglobales bacterium]|nr:FUSC family protein [Terriglobales bacterium]
MAKNHEMVARFSEWVIAQNNPPSIALVGLSAVATVTSYLIARLFSLPEAYWAAIASLMTMQLTLSAALPVAVQYVAGTAAGAAVGAVTDIYFHASVWVFAAAVVLVGLACVALRIERSAFRYASVTLVIVLLVPRPTSAPIVALHRFFEVTIGIAVGLVLFAIWQRIDLKLSLKAKRVSSAG